MDIGVSLAHYMLLLVLLLTYLQQVEMVLVHASCHARTAQGSICRHVNVLLLAPLKHSVIPPVGMHLHLEQATLD